MFVVEVVKFVESAQYAALEFLQVTFRKFIGAERLFTAADTVIVQLQIAITLVLVVTICMAMHWFLDRIV